MDNPLHGSKLWPTVCQSNRASSIDHIRFYHLLAFNSTLYWNGNTSTVAALCGKWFVQVTIVYWKSALPIRLLHWLYRTVQVWWTLADDFILRRWISSWWGTRGTWTVQYCHWCTIMAATGTCWSLARSKPTTDGPSERLCKVNSCLIFVVSTAKVYLWYSFRSLQCPLLR